MTARHAGETFFDEAELSALTTATPQAATGPTTSEAKTGTSTGQNIAAARARYSLMRQALGGVKPAKPADNVARVLNFLRTA